MNIRRILVSLYALNIMDAYSTILCINNGLQETNPFALMLLDLGIFLEYKIFIFAIIILLIYYLINKLYPDDRYMKFILFTVCIVYCIVIYKNFSYIESYPLNSF